MSHTPLAASDKEALTKRLAAIIERPCSIAEEGWLDPFRMLIVKTPEQKRFIALLFGETIILGDTFTKEGINTTAETGRRYGAESVLTIFSNALQTLAGKTDVFPKEWLLEEEEWARLEKELSPHPLNASKAQTRLYLLTNESCPACRKAQAELSGYIKTRPNLPFGVATIPLATNEALANASFSTQGKETSPIHGQPQSKEQIEAEKDSQLRFALANRKALASLTKTISLPAYVWRLGDGSLLFGRPSNALLQKRLALMAEGRL